MAGKWPYKRVEEIALKIAMGPFGSSIKVETFTDSGIPIISGQHLREAQVTDGEFNFITEAHADSLKNANVQRGDVIFTHAGNIGQVAFIPDGSAYQRYVISQRQFYLRCNTDLMLPEFITYYFKTPEGQHRLLANANQVGVPSIARPSSYLKTIEVPAPSIEEQLVVVRNIKALDAKIRLNIGINQTLEAMAQAIFKSWFVDFDPVKTKIAAKREGRDPLRAAMTTISGKPDAELDALLPEQYAQLAATAALFPEELEESELGEIPKGWAFQSAETLAEVGIGKTPPRKEPQWFTEGEGDWRWVSIKDMGASGVFQQRSSEFLTADAVSRFNVRVVPDRTVLLSFKLTIGRVAITDGPMVTNEAIAHFKLPCNPAISSEYLYLYLKSFDYSTLGSTSSIADAVNSKTIREMPITVASRDLIDRFTKSVAPLFEEMRNRQNEIASLGATRDALLPKLLSGEIEVLV